MFLSFTDVKDASGDDDDDNFPTELAIFTKAVRAYRWMDCQPLKYRQYPHLTSTVREYSLCKSSSIKMERGMVRVSYPFLSADHHHRYRRSG